VSRTSTEAEQIPLKFLFSEARFTFGFLTEHNILATLQFIATTIAIRINSYGYSPVQVAIAMSATALSFAVSAPLVYFLGRFVQKRGLIFMGLGFLGISVLMIGGSEYVSAFYDNIQMTFFGMGLIGFSVSMIAIPLLPEMMESVRLKAD
jgi:hypothetical protein